jgi:hypothetical protein
MRKSEMRAESAFRDCEARNERGVGRAEGVIRMVVLPGRARAKERRLRTCDWRRRRERVERRVPVARVLYWRVQRRESVPEGVERMRFRWEMVLSVCLR